MSKADPRSLTPARLLRAGVALALVVPALLVGGSAQATPGTDIRKVQATVDKLRHDAEVASEDYNETREQIKGLSVRMDAAQSRLQKAQAKVEDARRIVGRLAAESYQHGDLGSLELYLGDDPDALLAQAGVVDTLADRQALAIDRLRDSQKKLAADTAELGRQKAKIDQANAKLAQNKKDVEAKLKQAQAILDRLTAAQRRALERASRDAERGNGDTGDQDTSGPGGKVTCGDIGVKAPTARVQKVIDFACDQIGKPYSWGADGPGSYDCSGFTMASWARGGVSLPHSSRQQAGYGRRISKSDLQPGDLLFYYSPISHVTMYLGNGMMIHAPHSGDVVKIVPLRTSSLVAMTRL